MIHISLKPVVSQPNATKNEVADTGHIRIGGGFRLPTAAIVDNGRIRVGGGFRLPTG